MLLTSQSQQLVLATACTKKVSKLNLLSFLEMVRHHSGEVLNFFVSRVVETLNSRPI